MSDKESERGHSYVGIARGETIEYLYETYVDTELLTYNINCPECENTFYIRPINSGESIESQIKNRIERIYYNTSGPISLVLNIIKETIVPLLRLLSKKAVSNFGFSQITDSKYISYIPVDNLSKTKRFYILGFKICQYEGGRNELVCDECENEWTATDLEINHAGVIRHEKNT